MRTLAHTVVLVLVAGTLGCTTKATPAPPLAGPSGFALRLLLQSIPDSILQDGASQAAIQIEASGVDGRPVRGLSMRIEMFVNGIPQDYGTLSTRTAVTGEDGRARIVYTAPPRPAESTGEEVIVTFQVTPIGTDYLGEEPRTVNLRLIAPGVILPPNTAPQPAFTFSPDAALPLQDIVFDASGTTDERDADGNGIPCGALCTYRWDFGDGNTATGIFAKHQYRAMGTYQVRLTATDGRGASGTIGRAITIGPAALPTASFTFSPTDPALNQTIFFNAESSRPAPGRRIVFYGWDFGSGSTGSGVTTSKAYGTAGTYIVTLTVEDDAGATATFTQSVTVGAATTGPVADLTVSPPSGTTSTLFFFDASPSSGPSPIVEYRFTFGDNTPDVVGTSPTTAHRFTLPGSYVVRLTVRDSANRTSTVTVSVGVGAP
ncbi:MAG TPA: PKD domain-containing protein [Vicinamibacterales bacterium]|nr:PKD domain-containing protein [Vicinamibacterales bacterium]